MRLFLQFTIIFLLISLLVFGIGGVITYQVIKREVDLEQQRFLLERLDGSLRMIDRRNLSRPFTRDKISITPLGATGNETEVAFSDTLVIHSTLERMEPHVKLEVVKLVNDQYYKISLFDLIVEEDDIVDGVEESLLKMYLLLIALVLILGSAASYWLLKPFNKTLNQIKEFNLNGSEATKFDTSVTTEV